MLSIENAYAATAHAPNHVTREYGVKNNYIFGIPVPDLPIHYTTFIGLRRRLRVVWSHARTLVLEYCKGDDESQWERVKFDPPPPKNPLTDGHQNLCR